MHATSQSTVLAPARLRGGFGAYRGTTGRTRRNPAVPVPGPRSAAAPAPAEPDADWFVHPFVD
ncbi:hypothetical protein [Catenuloplanes atrovinosus]|uniref:Uncharacterized protein n=1 Tax=Catenuloplanes atrovinosus TaxID=137266 RepID=A0AAE4CBE9_9ACTN|nr:hypothetical protein [Catenuloplanes atrovinosus]MDR7278008.1 hypothetical protein [Catenuloplanes atrovinosus]